MGARGRLLAALAVAAGLAAALSPAAWAARSWHPPLALSAPGADAWVGKEVPSLSVMPNGTAVTAWREGDRDSSIIKVLEKPIGAPAIGPQKLGGGFNPPSVATTLDGHAYVAWVGTEDAGSGDTVFVSERLDGGAFGPPHALASGGLWSGQPGTAVAANARGDAVVLFTTGSWNDQRLWSARRTPDGVWHEPRPLGPAIGEAVWRLHAGISETGEAVFAWLSWDPDRDNSAWTAIEPPDGPAYDMRRMQAPGNRSTMPSLAVDHLGNAIVAWIEEVDDPTLYVGPVRAAVRAPGHPFAPAVDLGGSAWDTDAITAGLSDDGHAIVTWQSARANGPNGGSLGGVVAAVGLVPSGTFTPPEEVNGGGLADTPLTMAVDQVGNAAFFWVDWDTGEQRVVRRSVAGFYGRERAVVPCPRTRTYPVTAAVDMFGNASLLWNANDAGDETQSMWLSQDEPAAVFSPDPCPAPPPPLVWTPKDPQPGESVTFDATGFRDYYGSNLTTFRWDLDGDGSFESDTGEAATASHVFPEAGEHPITVEVSSHSRKTGNGGSGTYPYRIRVGSPPNPPNEYPAYAADPRPPDQPDEDPWPVGPIVDPTLPPLTGLPLGGPFELPGAKLLDRPGAGGAGTTFGGGRLGAAGLVVEAGRSARARALLGDGIPVRLTTARKVRVRLRLLAPGRRSLARPVSVVVPAHGQVIVRLKANRAGRRLLRRKRVRSLMLEALPAKGSKLRQRIRLR
jgi:hypothetical protein